jgi:hypothetical protein
MRELTEQLHAFEQATDDEQRNEIGARIRAAVRSDPDAARTFLHERRICDPEEALAAMSMVEALAGGDDGELRLLEWYFDVAAAQAAECPAKKAAVQVLTSYAFLEQRQDAAKHAMLPRYLGLTRSPAAPLRAAAVDLFGGFEVATAPGVRDELVRLLTDSDRQVRLGAEALLREEGVLPDGYRPSLLERIRRFAGL